MDSINSILRSNNGNKYLLYIYESIDKAMNIKALDSGSIKKVIVLSSIKNSYVEGTASSIDVCGQTVRNNLKEQDPERVLKYNEKEDERNGGVQKACNRCHGLARHNVLRRF
ncbi:MAG: hypothetical protein RXR36_04865 [Nitrososphaeria archaeon]